MKAILKANLFFLVPYILFLIVSGCILSLNSKTEIHLEFNAHHTDFFDNFFFYATYLGDGWTALIVFLMCIAVRFRYALIVAGSVLFSTLITQTLKHTIFADHLRPKKFFEGLHDLYFVPGVDNWDYNSFPSGHTTCAFALCFSLALITGNKNAKFLLFVAALLIGYSRIYLSQHFLEDVYLGSIIGTITAFAMFMLVLKSKKAWIDRSLIRSRNE